MATFVFLHGSFHAAWNWHKVLPILQSHGHSGIALDLPGHGLDTTHFRKISLTSTVNKVIKCLDALDEKAILVAHSRNGIVISKVAEECPEKVRGLVYLAAYLVPHGKSMMDYAIQDSESLVYQNVTPKFDSRKLALMTRLFKYSVFRWLGSALLPRQLQTHELKKAVYQEALYHDCPDEITELAKVLLEPESNWSGFMPLHLTAENYYRIPKVYIECLEDKAVTPKIQKKMYTDTPCNKLFSLQCSHSPFFSMPEKLVEVLMESHDVFSAD